MWENTQRPPRRAKRKEIDGQTILTSELLTMKIQKKCQGKQHKLNPQEIKDKQKEKEEEKKRLYRNKMKRKGKNIKERRNVP